jgi:hypothetical protein
MMPHAPRDPDRARELLDAAQTAPAPCEHDHVIADDLRPGQSVILTHRIKRVGRVEVGGEERIELVYDDGLVQQFEPSDGVPVL